MALLRLSAILFACLLGHLSVCRAVDDAVLRVMTFNIRYGTAPDGENAWPLRRKIVFRVVRDTAMDVIGLQEALRFQLDELIAEFPQYAMLGMGRDSNGGGEFSATLYNRSRFSVWQADTYWLSDTPGEAGSKSWGNSLPRICTWARLFDQQTKKSLYVFNTHWDHQSQPSRVRAGQLIHERIKSLNKNKEPVIVLGDFNIGQQNAAWVPLLEDGLRDAFRELHPGTAGVGTFHGFEGTIEGEKMDAVLVSEHWQIEAATINRTNSKGRYPSDHFPVTATLSLIQR